MTIFISLVASVLVTFMVGYLYSFIREYKVDPFTADELANAEVVAD